MRALAVVLLAGVAIAAQERAKVTRPMLASVEGSMDKAFGKIYPDNPFLVLGNSRGVYLDGYGAVFSAEVNLVLAAGGPFRGKVTKEEAEHHRKEKLQRIPLLRKSMKTALVGAAMSLDTLPPEEKVVLAVSLFQHSWEDLNGVPQQIVVSAQRKTLLQMKTAGADESVVNASIQVKEY